MSILDDTVRYEEQSMVEYTKNKDNEIMTTIQHYIGKQIEENRQRFGGGGNKEIDLRRGDRQM